MPRQKSTPAKFTNQECSMPCGYIPKIRRKPKKNRSQRAYSHKVVKPTDDNKQYFLGELYIGRTANILPPNWSTCAACILPAKEEDAEESLVLNFENSLHVVVKLDTETNLVRDILRSKTFALDLDSREGGKVYFLIYLLQLPLAKFFSTVGNCLKSLFSLMYNISYDSSARRHSKKLVSLEVESFYGEIREEREKNLVIPNENVQNYRLNFQLRPYQSDAVKWMIHREKQSMARSKDFHHPLYTKVKLKSGLDIYFDKYSGYIELNPPIVYDDLKGGILADEMGLGKTVEVLACILNHIAPHGNADKVDLSLKPTIKCRIRKRKLVEDPKEEEALVENAKKIKVPEEWVKKPKKGQTYTALSLWYQKTLESVYIKKRKPDILVQCICGVINLENTVSCVDCGKVQHEKCNGYNIKLGVFRCPQCWIHQPLINTKATLIVCPTSLRKQWCNEILKHVKGNFNVLQYDGCTVMPIYPTDFQNYDLVITTYNVLQHELRLLGSRKVMPLRNRKKYSPPCCPLTAIKWWRLCLDEAQTVESPTQMVSIMVTMLRSQFRWAVTGTPISKDISELYGLVDYLKIEPYNELPTWEHLLLNPYVSGNPKPMHKFLANVMWRSSKTDVLDQINLPKQSYEVNCLTFSAVEKYFYKCENEANRALFWEKISKYDQASSLESFDKGTLKNLLSPLLSLRQVCTFPNTVKIRYLLTKKPVSSMRELLDALIDKNATENEEILRLVISSINGLAGIYLLLQNPYQSIEEYRKVLQLYTRFTEEEKVAKVNVDKLLIIHTMHNLAEILHIYPDIVAPTLRDSNLKKDQQEIEQKYIEKFANQSLSALRDSMVLTENVIKLQNSFILKAGEWYTDLLQWTYIKGYNSDLETRIRTAHGSANVECSIHLLFDQRDVQFAIGSWDDTISTLRDETIESIENLYEYIPDQDFEIAAQTVQKARDCHLRPDKKSKAKKCPVCVANKCLKAYEFKLFSMVKRKETFEEMSLTGSWKPASEELVFRSLSNFAKAKHARPEIVRDAETHINLIDILKKEFKEIRRLWTFLDQQICAQDELDICKTRLRLADPNAKDQDTKKRSFLENLSYVLENKAETIHVLHEHQLDYQRSLLLRDESVNMNKLEKNIGTRKYLETLKRQQYEGQNPDPCPICKNDLTTQWSILSCGHSYCIECIESLMGGFGTHHYVTCSVCRSRLHVSNISYVKPGQQESINGENEIKGNYSTKIEAIVKLLIKLKYEDEDVKVLVFSTWIDVLKYLKDALNNNGVECELALSGNLEKQITKFKDEEQNVTALLLPVQLGSKGLNLIEATHVILVEPLLNPSDELQAIGRIHRIGQTKPTTVHKFFVKDTIEENIYKAVTANADQWDKTKVTLGQIWELFAIDANTSLDEEDVSHLTPESSSNLVQESNSNLIQESSSNLTQDSNSTLHESVNSHLTEETTANSTIGASSNLNEEINSDLAQQISSNLEQDATSSLNRQEEAIGKLDGENNAVEV